MCLILFAVQPNDQQHLVVAANRDEQHSRETARADYWQDHPNILAGRDLVAGGTWLGVTTGGRFAAVTNFAEPIPEPVPPRSRGELTANFLIGDEDCVTYLERVQKQRLEYRGFNLLISDGKSVYYYSNRSNNITELQAGHYGLSNQLLDCDWPKVNAGREQLKERLESGSESLFKLLACRGDGSPHSAHFILGDTYGTSVSTVVEMTASETRFEERAFNPKGEQTAAMNQLVALNKLS